MRDWLLYLSALLGGVFFLANGLLMLVSPKKYLRFYDWLSGADKWSELNPASKIRWSLQWRLAGAVFIVFGIMVTYASISAMLNPSTAQIAPLHPSRVKGEGTDWTSFGVGLVMFVGGLFNLVRPQLLVAWAARKSLPHRIIPDATLRGWTVWVRLMGAMMLLGSVTAISAWLKSL